MTSTLGVQAVVGGAGLGVDRGGGARGRVRASARARERRLAPGPANRAGRAARQADRLDDFPRGLVRIGDAICRFNPSYGQGMSVAALEARALSGLLSTHGAVLAARDFTAHKLAEVQYVLKPRPAYRDAELVSRGLALMAEG